LHPGIKVLLTSAPRPTDGKWRSREGGAFNEASLKRNVLSVFVGGIALLALAALGIGSIPWISHAAEEAKEERPSRKPKEEKATGGEICCKEGDTTPTE
jgi:hypothetical protein